MKEKKIVVVVEKNHIFPSCKLRSPQIVPAGKWILERRPNPMGVHNLPWLYIQGTGIGASEMYWRSWDMERYGDARIKFL